MIWKLSPEAEQDIANIWRYSAQTWGRKQADTYFDQLEASVIRLSEYPELGRKREEIAAGIRSFPQGQHVIFYRIQGDTLEVARILHRRMDANSHIDAAD